MLQPTMLFEIEDSLPLRLAKSKINCCDKQLVPDGLGLGHYPSIRINNRATANEALTILNTTLGNVDTPESILVASSLT